jgi:putative ABC transport system permease protein
MPYTAAYVFNPDKTFSGIYLQARSEDVVDEVKQETTEILLRRYDDDQFSVIEQAEILQTVTGIFAAVNSVLVAIGAISLLVGGIGIMNIMYASVTERVKEVGIRRAIGATEGDILQQFLSESVVLSLVGGLLALGVAAVVVLIVRQWFPAAIEMSSVLLALGVSSGIGVFFGVFPARKAAKLPPIEAIKK